MYKNLIKDLKEWPRVCCQYEDSIDQLHDQAADALETLTKIIPCNCFCCVGCEVEPKDGHGCEYGFVLSPDRAKQYIDMLLSESYKGRVT